LANPIPSKGYRTKGPLPISLFSLNK